jgi:NlpC/P60 family putative phage cell wall peptidase
MPKNDTLRDAICAEARRWRKTPYWHQAALISVGVDCVGLIRAVGHACGVLADDAAQWRPFAAYSRLPRPERMGEAMRTFLHEIDPADVLPGDILWIQWRDGLPMHLALYLGETIIHALYDVGFVAEHGYSAEWRERTHSVWRYPGLVGQ